MRKGCVRYPLSAVTSALHWHLPSATLTTLCSSVSGRRTSDRHPCEVDLDLGRPEDDLSAATGCGGRRARPEGRHCGQRLGKGPTRPPGPVTSQDAHQTRHSTPRSLDGILMAGLSIPSDAAISGLRCPGRPQVEIRAGEALCLRQQPQQVGAPAPPDLRIREVTRYLREYLIEAL
jgi:hypothetical protein